MKIIDTTSDNVRDFGICGYKDIKRPGYPEKLEWLNDRFKEGLKIKTMYSETDGAQGMIEYIPGKYCWRPVEANGYMFIHCLFVGFKRIHKGKGYASLLIDECINDAKKGDIHGVAVVTRKSSFMVGKEIFLKNGFKVVDNAPSDFELLIQQFNDTASLPRFKPDVGKQTNRFGDGLKILRAFQCPYTVKNVNEICETAEKYFGITPEVIELKNYEQAQNNPCAFGTFCILYNGEIIAEHPISNTRFSNIINKILK